MFFYPVRAVVINTPEEIDKKDIRVQPSSDLDQKLLKVSDFFKSKIFWIISLTFAFNFLPWEESYFIFRCTQKELVYETFPFSFPIKQYVFAYSLAAFGGVVGKVFFGYLVDKLNPNKPVMIMMLMQSLGILASLFRKFPTFLPSLLCLV